ncbi:hypothetical protein JQS43_24575 [Natronosporangium hydrolyticum]|uniref:Uncharacterized protein n=1 Tax=Natronosporangium hydrolyticum TaxID=2811111 RepID=A0A895YJ35_9ACTN|nr:hypothetical protein [Natronosporangium hydrolyticum]QSB14606.1 hypothetical protein JQS43_24575 [Natronosporangium hydrolyticum]
MNWGDGGTTGAVNFYLALVYAVAGEIPPIPPPAVGDDPRSMFGWLRRQQGAEVGWEWPVVVQRVAEDKPLREAVTETSRERNR